MINQVKPKTRLGCITILIIVIFIISYFTAGSLNPLDVYAKGSTLSKIIVTLLLGIVFLSIIQLIFYFIMRKAIEMKTRMPAEDVICPGCGFPLIQYTSSHGMPIECPICKRFWHNGPACYNKGMKQNRIVFPIYPCPICRSGGNQDEDMFDGLDLS